MEKIGYVLAEAPVFCFMIWFSIRLIQYRRSRDNRPIYGDRDRRMLFDAAKYPRGTRIFRFKLALTIAAVTAAALVEFIVLASLGAAILSGALLFTSAAIVYRLLLKAD